MEQIPTKRWLHDLRSAINTLHEAQKYLLDKTPDPALAPLLAEALGKASAALERQYEGIRELKP